MAEILTEVFVIKATSKVTGDIHYVNINDGYVELVKHNTDGTLYKYSEDAEQAIEGYCDGEETHEYTVSGVMLTEEELMLVSLN